jgi:predicted metal-dependent HD superfamily phosphohydrolase
MNMLELSWQRTIQGLHLSQPHENLRDRLTACYQEPQRHYHTLQHLAECISLLNSLPSQANHPPEQLAEIEIALWFHDAIYDVQSTDNERKSADWAVLELSKAGVSQEVANRIDGLIMVTKHDAQPQLASEQLLVDIDLSILGAAPNRFAQYDKQVRQEYAWVPEELYRTKRTAILQQFLDHTFIYNTLHFRDTREAQARLNLQTAIMNMSVNCYK